MKTIICLAILLSINISISFSQSTIDYGSGTGLIIQPGADVCADKININGTYTGGGTMCGSSAYIMNITAFIQGFYDSTLNVMVSDTARAYLRNSAFPYAIVDSSKSKLDPSGSATFNFPNAVNGTSYYLVIKQRNSIETWSSSGNSFSSNFLAYNFSTAATKAYGNNLKLVDTSPVRYAIFSGDPNQDGLVNLADLIKVFNDGTIFLTGYVPSDINGNNVVNLADLVITQNNSSAFVMKKRP
ncbi:MAG: hypothetical protein ABI462_12515 [Ignavibacteria bacterium]